MVIHNLNILRPLRRPYKTNPKLVIDTDTVLTGTITLQCFEPIARRDTQVFQHTSEFQLLQLAPRDCFNVVEAPDTQSLKEVLRINAFEGQDRHAK